MLGIRLPPMRRIAGLIALGLIGCSGTVTGTTLPEPSGSSANANPPPAAPAQPLVAVQNLSYSRPDDNMWAITFKVAKGRANLPVVEITKMVIRAGDDSITVPL